MAEATTHVLTLDGCRPVPLAHYLKALGLLRLVAEQLDPAARGAWIEDSFLLETRADQGELESFFLHAYAPTPLVAPWNGGSGFHSKDNRVALEALAGSVAPRFAPYRQAIAAGKQALALVNASAKVEKESKPELLQACRATFPDAAVAWLDAVCVLSAAGPKYPPLLGTGGNDGRLEFTNNYMQRLLDLFALDELGSPRTSAGSLLREALFGDATAGLNRGAAIGQFLPGRAGGANAEAGFSAESLTNPWDYVFMLEGSVVFAGAAARRLETTAPGAFSYPFTVRPTAAGYTSAAPADERSARAEMWLPLWDQPTGLAEVLALLSEGRARVGRRAARTGVDFARSVAALGIDRGLTAFERYGFHVRNGLSYLATPLGRFRVPEGTAPGNARLLEHGPLDQWIEQLRRKAADKLVPSAVARVQRLLDGAILALCIRDDRPRLEAVLVALARCERALARSLAWTLKNGLRPVPPLPGKSWLPALDDRSAEFAIAKALASLKPMRPEAHKKDLDARSFRGFLVPLEGTGGRLRFFDRATREVVWVPARGLLANLRAVLQRRLLQADAAGLATYPDTAAMPCPLSAVIALLEGDVDERRTLDLVHALSLLDLHRWTERAAPDASRIPPELPSYLYRLLKLCFGTSPVLGQTVRMTPPIALLCAAGRGSSAAQHAVRRLRSSGLAPLVRTSCANPTESLRTAAALLLPLSPHDLELLARSAICQGPRQTASVLAQLASTTTEPEGVQE